MVLDNTNTNIPKASVGEVIEALTALYSRAICSGMPLHSLPAPFLWGPFGVGKSDGVRQLAAALEHSTGKRVQVTDIRLLLFSPVDLRGVPVASADGFSEWLKPRIFDMDASDEVVNILFLDELSAAPQSVQAAAYQITLDRVIGEHKLPDNCIVIAAGNRTTDRSVAYAMPKALCNRLLHFDIRSDVASWLDWAIRNRIDDRIVGFISFDNSRLNLAPETGDMAFPTPRSWTFVSNLLKTVQPETVSDMHMLLSSAVGIDTAVAFEAFCETTMHLPDVRKIFKGSCREYPTSHQVLYALISSMTAAIRESPDLSLTELEHACMYATHFPPDFARTFFTDIGSIEGVREKLPRIRALQQWRTHNHS